MADFPTIPAGMAIPLVDTDTWLFPEPTMDALSATIESLAGSGLQDLYAKMKAGIQTVDALFVCDSTGTIGEGAQAWTYYLPGAIAAEFPGRTVRYVPWDYVAPGSQAGVAWLSPVTVQTGAGPVITLWLAGAAANNWRYFFNSVRRDAIFTAARFDVMLFALGHNDGFSIPTDATWRQVSARNAALIEWARLYQPQAKVVLSSQNPRTAAAGDNTPLRNEIRNDLYRADARKRGWGYINITQAFYDDGRAIPLVLVDSGGVHPTAAGGQLWCNGFMDVFRSSAYAPQLPDQIPALTRRGSSLVNLRSLPSLTLNLTETEDGAIRRRSPKSLHMVKTANSSQAYRRWVLPIDQVRGRNIFAMAWIYIPTVGYASTGAFWLIVDGTVVADSIIESGTRDQWMPIAATAIIPTTASEVRVQLMVDPTSSSSVADLYLDEGSVWIGDAPFDTDPQPTAPDSALGKAASLKAIASINAISPASFKTNWQPNASAERDAPGFTTFDSGGTRIERSAEWSATGDFSHKVTGNATLQHDNARTDAAYLPVAAPGDIWTVSAVFKNPNATSRDFRSGLAYYNSSKTRIGAVELPGASATTIAAGASQRITATGTAAPAGTAFVGLIASRRGSGNAVGGDVFYVDDLILVKSATVLTAPANADTDDLYFYEGTPGISASKGIA